jgi:hypothetical protein
MRGSIMAASSDAAEAARVKREQAERAETDGEVENVGHGGLRNWFQLRNMDSTRLKSRWRRMPTRVKKT